jgi:hypothetical protein
VLQLKRRNGAADYDDDVYAATACRIVLSVVMSNSARRLGASLPTTFRAQARRVSFVVLHHLPNATDSFRTATLLAVVLVTQVAHKVLVSNQLWSNCWVRGMSD